MEKRKIRILIKEPNKPCYVRDDLVDSLHNYQSIVGGLIESVVVQELSKEGIVCYCNEEGKLLELEPNFVLVWDEKIYDCVCGTVVFLRDDGEGGNASLTDEDIEFITSYLNLLSDLRGLM